MDAVQWLPRDNKEWLVARDRWKCTVLASRLSAATKVVAIVIADFYINRNPQSRHFNWAWAAQELLARTAGVSRRTVASAMNELELMQLIIIDRGGGRKGARGRTHRYTLRMDHLSDDRADPADDVQNLHSLGPGEDVNILHNSADLDKHAECANGDVEMGNLRPKQVNGLPTTPSNTPLRDSLYGRAQKAEFQSDLSKRLSRKNENNPSIQSFLEPNANKASSIDHTNLALLIGAGDVRVGWEILMRLPDGVVDKMALQFKYDKSSGLEISEHVHSLLAGGAKRADEPH
jgi:hypothetical protein